MLLNKKFIVLIAFICLFFSVVTLQDTYAKYTSAVSETTDIAIARWRILVNDFDIRSNASTTNLILPDFDGNNYIASGVIAPTATGSFELAIDASGADLAFDYTITVTNSLDSPVSDIKVTGCTLNGNDYTVQNGVITGRINLNDQRVNTFVVFIEWNDGNDQNMDNAADTATTTLGESVAKLSVVANFTQVGSPTPTPSITPTPTPVPEP